MGVGRESWDRRSAPDDGPDIPLGVRVTDEALPQRMDSVPVIECDYRTEVSLTLTSEHVHRIYPNDTRRH